MTKLSTPAARSPAQILSELHALLASDGHAASFQSLAQYRSSMLTFIQESQSQPPGDSNE